MAYDGGHFSHRSLGVLLYVILSGCSPFAAEEEEALLALVAAAKYEFHAEDHG
jgi:hypothetical protein